MLLGLVTWSGLSVAAPAAEPGNVELGRRIYQQGVLADGSPLIGHRGELGKAQGTTVACETCHRRSGMGGQEGRILVPPITGAALFNTPQAHRPVRPGRPDIPAPLGLRHQTRTAYDSDSLATALRDGLDGRGRPFGALMPRYSLDERNLAHLEAYLRQLSSQAPVGIQDGQIELATIIAPDAPAARRHTVLTTLQAWASRATLRGMRLRLHVWELSGDPAGWAAQLEQHWRTQPVWAVVSGAGQADWEPVQAFCEAHTLPCVLPLIDRLPAGSGARHYSVYYSAGVQADAQIAARYLQQATPMPKRLVQLVADPVGHDAAQELQAALADSGITIETRRWTPDGAAAWLDPLGADVTLVAWLDPARLGEVLAAAPTGAKVRQLIVSGQRVPPGGVVVPPAWQDKLVWASTRSDPTRLRGGIAMTMTTWLRSIGIAEENAPVQSEVYAATFFLGDAMARMGSLLTSDYLMEKLENGINNRPAGAAYYSLSLGPGQRVAAKGGRIIGTSSSTNGHLEPLTPILQAED